MESRLGGSGFLSSIFYSCFLFSVYFFYWEVGGSVRNGIKKCFVNDYHLSIIGILHATTLATNILRVNLKGNRIKSERLRKQAEIETHTERKTDRYI